MEVPFAFQSLSREESGHALCVTARPLCLWPSSFRSVDELTFVKSLERVMPIGCFAPAGPEAFVIHGFSTFFSCFPHLYVYPGRLPLVKNL